MPRAGAVFVAICLSTAGPLAQEPVAPAEPSHRPMAIEAHAMFFADNSEFSNPFREGETMFGVSGRVFLDLPLGQRASLRAGVFGRQVFGSDEAFDDVRPVLALVIGGPASRLVFGTLETVRRADGMGPDRLGPHGLLPPLQRETLAFERPWEAGLQWIVDNPRIKQDMWIHWQRVQSSFERERFDGGLNSRFQANDAMAFQAQMHVVHEGGQLFAAGAVRDSLAGALGVIVGGPAGPVERVSLETHVLLSRFTPDRAEADRSRSGVGVLVRIAAESHGWRAHGLLSRTNDFIKEEGDRHYQSLRRDGSEFRALRDYAEAGLTRSFGFGPYAALEASARWHRVENDYEYSYRLIAIVGERWPLSKP
jgi:hypothetical protein